MIRKVGKYEIVVSDSPITVANCFYTTFLISQGEQALTIKYPSYELTMTLAYSEDEESIDYCLAKYRSEVNKWLNEIDTFLGIN